MRKKRRILAQLFVLFLKSIKMSAEKCFHVFSFAQRQLIQLHSFLQVIDSSRFLRILIIISVKMCELVNLSKLTRIFDHPYPICSFNYNPELISNRIKIYDDKFDIKNIEIIIINRFIQLLSTESLRRLSLTSKYFYIKCLRIRGIEFFGIFTGFYQKPIKCNIDGKLILTLLEDDTGNIPEKWFKYFKIRSFIDPHVDLTLQKSIQVKEYMKGSYYILVCRSETFNNEVVSQIEKYLHKNLNHFHLMLDTFYIDVFIQLLKLLINVELLNLKLTLYSDLDESDIYILMRIIETWADKKRIQLVSLKHPGIRKDVKYYHQKWH